MATSQMEKLRAAFGKLDSENSNNRSGNYYPFWNMNDGQQAVVRFLPDKNTDNPLQFLVEKSMHNLIINGEKKSVPCLKMYGEDCPICKVAAEFYNAGDKDSGKAYYKKRQHLAQAIVLSDPLPADTETEETHENKVRRLALGFQLFNVIKDTYDELDEVPFAYEGGTDFIIKKTKSGEYSTYATASKFSRKSSNLTDEQIEIAEANIVDLETLLPAKPNIEEVESMLEAALNGVEYQENKSDDVPTPESDAKSNSDKTEKSSDNENKEYEEDADEILNMIRNRHKNKA